jgi:amidohydrolase
MSTMVDFFTDARELFDYTQSLRRDFHQHPELGFAEHRTSEIVARELHKSGVDLIKTGVARTGVVGILSGGKPGPVVLLRFDMDALPVVEETGAPYASKMKGVMHACGHDGHTAAGLTIARLLATHKDKLAGSVKFVFQPAEEGLGGASLMVKEGILENPNPDYSLAMHVWNEKPCDWLGITAGPIMAAAETFRIKVSGKGGHGAAPHQTIDPIFAAAQIVTAMQSIVSRNVPPLESAVVSVGSIQGGSAFNIIPPDVILMGTIRSFRPEIREQILIRFNEIIHGISSSLGCEAEVEVQPITPAVINDAALTKQVASIASTMFPKDEIDTSAMTMGSEDFAFMMEGIPGCFIFVGSANSNKGLDAKHHHPKFDFDETALTKGVALLAKVTANLMDGS